MRRIDSLEKTLMLGGIGGRRRRGWQRMRWLDGITDLMDVSLSELRALVKDRKAWCAAIHGVVKRWLSNWTELNWMYMFQCHSLKSSHPLLPLLCWKVFYVCFSFTALQIGFLVLFIIIRDWYSAHLENMTRLGPPGLYVLSYLWVWAPKSESWGKTIGQLMCDRFKITRPRRKRETVVTSRKRRGQIRVF